MDYLINLKLNISNQIFLILEINFLYDKDLRQKLIEIAKAKFGIKNMDD